MRIPSKEEVLVNRVKATYNRQTRKPEDIESLSMKYQSPDEKVESTDELEITKMWFRRVQGRAIN